MYIENRSIDTSRRDPEDGVDDGFDAASDVTSKSIEKSFEHHCHERVIFDDQDMAAHLSLSNTSFARDGTAHSRDAILLS
jgi:hypothetical protein